MSPCFPFRRPPRMSFPRVSGDEPAGDKIILGINEFSPRERG